METNVKAIELRDLWRRYKANGDDKARERLVVASAYVAVGVWLAWPVLGGE